MERVVFLYLFEAPSNYWSSIWVQFFEIVVLGLILKWIYNRIVRVCRGCAHSYSFWSVRRAQFGHDGNVFALGLDPLHFIDHRVHVAVISLWDMFLILPPNILIYLNIILNFLHILAIRWWRNIFCRKYLLLSSCIEYICWVTRLPNHVFLLLIFTGVTRAHLQQGLFPFWIIEKASMFWSRTHKILTNCRHDSEPIIHAEFVLVKCVESIHYYRRSVGSSILSNGAHECTAVLLFVRIRMHFVLINFF